MGKMAVIKLLVIILCILCFCGCGNRMADDTQTEASPKGVCYRGEKEYYRIMLPGTKASSAFNLTGAENKVAIKEYMSGGSSQIVYFREVSQGGWLAYTNGETGLVLYFSAQFDINEVQLKCYDLTKDKDNYMSWNEAKKYIPFLK